MTEEEVIEVSYDRTGVPTPTANTDGFSAELSDYLYPKIYYIDNDDGEGNEEFTEDDIENYSLEVVDDKINISTTRRLIKYLKAYARKAVENIDSRLDLICDKIRDLYDKLAQLRQYIDAELEKIWAKINELYDLLDEKADAIHTHEISDIIGLRTILDTIETKASKEDLANHVNNKKNPHMNDSGWQDASNSTIPAKQRPHCRKIGNLVIFTFHAQFTGRISAGSAVCKLKEEFRPDETVYGVVYKDYTSLGDTAAYSIDKDTGNLTLGYAVTSGEIIRIHEVYFAKQYI